MCPSPQNHQLFSIHHPPKFSEVRQIIRCVRSTSAPGPNRILYKLYKNCPKLLKLLWSILRMVWMKQIIPSVWQRAFAFFIPMEQNRTSRIGQFRRIALLNVKGKIFFAVMVRRMPIHLTENGYY